MNDTKHTPKTTLTKEEASAVLNAIGQMTNGNAYDFAAWKSQTSGTKKEWNALCRAEKKLGDFT